MKKQKFWKMLNMNNESEARYCLKERLYTKALLSEEK